MSKVKVFRQTDGATDRQMIFNVPLLSLKAGEWGVGGQLKVYGYISHIMGEDSTCIATELQDTLQGILV